LTIINRQDASGYLGKTLTFQASTAADTLVGGQAVHLLINNTSGSTVTCLITTPEVVEGILPVGDRTVTGITTASITEVPIPSRYNDPATGLATVAISAPGATVTLAAVQGSAQA
jgi:hypothetical protein